MQVAVEARDSQLCAELSGVVYVVECLLHKHKYVFHIGTVFRIDRKCCSRRQNFSHLCGILL